MEPTSGRIYTSHHVRFNETEFPYQTLTKPNPVPNPNQPAPSSEPYTIIPGSLPLIQTSQPAANDQTPSLGSPPPVITETMPASLVDTGPVDQPHVEKAPQAIQPSETAATAVSSVTTLAAVEPQASPRHSMTTRSRNNIVKKTSKYNLHVELRSDPHWIPTTWQQATKHPLWRKAMYDEFNYTTQNRTWDLVETTRHMNTIGCRWVFTIKYNPDGSIDRYKARIKAKGFHQKPGVDYEDTFSLVIKYTTIRLVLGLAINKDCPIRQIDVNTAFLQGHLDEEVFMCQPPGFQDADRPTHSCRLQKALYGLKQAPRAWYSELKKYLLSAGFHNSLADTSLFILRHEGQYVYLLVYVDDILVTGTDSTLVQRGIKRLAAKISIKDMGHLSYFLGIEVIRTKQGLHLMQRTYVTDLLQKTNMLHAKPVATPLPSSPKLTLHSGPLLYDPFDYRRVVRSLQYLALTRPDVSYDVNRLSQFMHKPSVDHWNAVKRMLCYLAGTLSHGIFLRKQSSPQLHALSDADLAGDTDDYGGDWLGCNCSKFTLEFSL